MRIEVISGDATVIEGDVLALKYAQARYGLDAYVAGCLQDAGHADSAMKPGFGDFSLLPGAEGVVASKILFIGVPGLWDFGYQEIRNFGRRVLATLAKELPFTRRLLVTVHGPGYGLDEVEAFESQVAGFVDAVTTSDVPVNLEIITVVEKNVGRAQRLQRVLAKLVPAGVLSSEDSNLLETAGPEVKERLRSVGYTSASKAHAFVAMPFSDEFEDIYHYGILNAVKNAGMICERADLAAFTGDVVAWIRERVRTATLVIADLSGANPNVYLEVGFAWGSRVPTVLLARDIKDLQFDVRGQRCLIYSKIRDLEEKLTSELRTLGHGSPASAAPNGAL